MNARKEFNILYLEKGCNINNKILKDVNFNYFN